MPRIHVHVKPNSKQQSIHIGEDGSWMIRLNAPPVDGKANAELLKVLAKHFKVPKSSVQIKAGQSSRHKTIEIDSDNKITTIGQQRQ